MTSRPEPTGPPEATGLILAGGRSSRFGRDKLAEPYLGMPLLHHTVLRVAEVCGEIVVALAFGAPEPELPPGPSVRVARDATEGEGPLAGVRAGLDAARSGPVLIVAGDMPRLGVPVLRELLRTAAATGAAAVALRDRDRVRPVPSVVDAVRASEVAASMLRSGRRRLGELLEELDVRAIDEAAWRALDPEGATLFDVDEPGDLST